MSGPLDIAYAGADQSIRDPIRALPRTPGERFDAELAASMAPDRYFKQTGAMRDLWTDALDKLHAVTGERLENPEDTSLVSRDRATTYRDTTEARAARRQKATDAIRAARTAGADDLPDPENFERYIAEDSRRRRETAASYVDTGNGLAAFGGSVVGESISPHGLVGFLVPPARLMTLGAEVALGGFVRSVGREALMQGGAGIATQAAGEALDYAARKPLGTQQTAGEIAENVIGAGIGGAVLGGAFRGAHEALRRWRGMTPEQRAEAPAEVKDAAAALERAELDTGKNPLPRGSEALHERILERAQESVLNGRPARVLLPDMDTPLTAVGRALAEPDTGGFRLPRTAELIRDVPDADIVALARETRPKSFLHIDRVDGDLDAARTRLETIEADRRAIGYADVVDADTGYRLADIEARLERPALRAQERARLEDERAMILESVDRDGTLAARLEKSRDTVLTPDEIAERDALRARIAELERERVIAAQDADAATAWTKERLDRIGERAGLGDGPGVDSVAAEIDMPAFMRAGQARAFEGFPEYRAPRRPVAEPTPPPTREQVDANVKAAESPEAFRALDTEVARIMAADPDKVIMLAIGDEGARPVKIATLLEDARAAEAEAQAAASCAMGAAL